MHGGDLVAEVLRAQGVPFLFTLCGGHISPILVGCKARGIRVIDTRHEATAVFAADAVSRLSGRPGVAAVTAGPGLSNTVTAVKNAQIAQSPLILLGGATATLLKGRGSLQDIDQMALLRPHVKWAATARRVAEIVPLLERAFAVAQEGVPGPAFLELPLDLLYDEPTVRRLYGAAGGGGGLAGRALRLYMGAHLARLFGGADRAAAGPLIAAQPPVPPDEPLGRAAAALERAERPLLLVGAQALLDTANVGLLAAAVERLGLPVYLSSGARGLLGKDHPLQMRHQRRAALKDADLVILAGVPCDFRLDYGRHIRRRATYVAANRSRADIALNRRPDIAALGDPGLFLRRLAMLAPPAARWAFWREALIDRDDARNAAISRQAAAPSAYLNPVQLCREIEAALPDDSILVGDGGDFVATASYVIRPRGPLRWLDPGPYGTLGVGAGFALGAKLCRPEAEVWALFGDGAFGYGVAELDTFVRHGIAVIAVVGNDAGWTQIAREQGEMLGDLVGTELAATDYHRVAEGFGAAGLALDDPELTEETLAQARSLARAGRPVLINARLGKTDFRKGSISV
ncbi:thiamine pyrophosphate-binding protein [Oscillochloris sp. ZM17-4]|uniref:thiamine pyrophosphate-binding protein n=1 Tax=Oscillochloris sp. ZM17-4 TaxID=2866714 RepID=UPI001C73B9BD|nr:thiamine pyrophosphate-binding protein [Oscillochloris sp. ZM17-4]MBX0329347.1 thiamine pyrophosphate-binding protein [Oscillochloris sp. ZM17-4]